MKKLIALVLVMTTLFTLASCNLSNDTTTAPTTSSGSNDTPSEGYQYTAFTSSEAQLFMDEFGTVIPFIPNNEYSVEEYSDPSEYYTVKGIRFQAYGNTQEEFDAYLEMFSDYEGASFTNSSGVTQYWYWSEKLNFSIVISFVESEGQYSMQANTYHEVKGGTAGISTGIPYDELFTNEGAGLPSDPDGVYDVDFTKGEYIKNVADQALYLDGCPTVGSPGVLVIPVQFSDVTAESKGYTTDTLVEALSKGGKTDYFSLYDYYYIASYGQLTLDITVLDFWFTPEHDSEYYYQFSFMYEGEEHTQGEQLIIHEALDYLDDFMDLSQFDSDGNGTIDSVILVNTLGVNPSNMFFWAFRDFNYYRDEAGNYYEYDGVHAKDYMWLTYQSLHATRDEKGNPLYDNITGMNTHTLIHEFGHVLGLDDYYDYTNLHYPLYGRDIMDDRNGDQNAYSKFNLGWLTTSRLVVTDGSITLTLEDFSKSGDTILLANNWDDRLGAYQEYYILVYYTNHGLNTADDTGYFETDGVLVYHVNAAMFMQEGEDHYDVYNRNTDVIHERGTENNLIGFVLPSDDWIFGVGDTMPVVTDDYGNELMYSFTVDALTSEYATITVIAK